MDDLAVKLMLCQVRVGSSNEKSNAVHGAVKRFIYESSRVSMAGELRGARRLFASNTSLEETSLAIAHGTSLSAVGTAGSCSDLELPLRGKLSSDCTAWVHVQAT